MALPMFTTASVTAFPIGGAEAVVRGAASPVPCEVLSQVALGEPGYSGRQPLS